ncbi:Sel1 repeat protein [Beggiatoa alba B18LD]|uniref:Sel1 repeat protein n=1 Tax=Beggiatoa alba B18LD TaxID=395493 RepID=I3CBR4_9GAMM|nr:tetratricopeptide repeat protein [Beggiatoa alba]EIJ41057.1 Sel1 repeat protein [Beggiatoa alba B18LD]
MRPHDFPLYHWFFEDELTQEQVTELCKEGNRFLHGEENNGIREVKKAIDCFKQASRYNCMEAIIALGHIYTHYPPHQNATTAFYWYRRAYEQGSIEATYQLGLLYRDGKGVAVSHETAAACFLEAAEAGHAEAQCQLGMLFHKTMHYPYDNYTPAIGLFKNRAKAHFWLEKSAKQGCKQAQYELGQWYEKEATYRAHDGNLDAKVNHDLAIKWYEEARKQECHQAELCLKYLQKSPK